MAISHLRFLAFFFLAAVVFGRGDYSTPQHTLYTDEEETARVSEIRIPSADVGDQVNPPSDWDIRDVASSMVEDDVEFEAAAVVVEVNSSTVDDDVKFEAAGVEVEVNASETQRPNYEFTPLVVRDEEDGFGVISKIAFGSCSNQSAPQPMWNAINAFDPHVFIWLGDIVYADDELPNKFMGNMRTAGPFKNTPKFLPNSREEMERRYMLQKHNHGYSKMLKRTKVFGVYDDHDYGLDNAGKELSFKNISQELLLNFLDEPSDSLRRRQEGVYTSYILGTHDKSVKIILLDTRYHRDYLQSDGTILGETQWLWLQKELEEPETNLTIIGSSVQVISNLSAFTHYFLQLEGWGSFPSERNRLFKLLERSNRNGTIFISGDVHFGEIAKIDCHGRYSIYDFTSSGITQCAEKEVSEHLALGFRFLAWLTPAPMRVFSKECFYKSCLFGQPNFGAIEINWTASPVTITVEVRSVENSRTLGVELSIEELQGAGNRKHRNNDHCLLENDQPFYVKYRVIAALALLISLAVVAIPLSVIASMITIMIYLVVLFKAAKYFLVAFGLLLSIFGFFKFLFGLLKMVFKMLFGYLVDQNRERDVEETLAT